MVMLTDATDRAARRFYEQSRGNGSYHELALRIAAAAWRQSYPEATEEEAAAAVKGAVGTHTRRPSNAADDEYIGRHRRSG